MAIDKVRNYLKEYGKDKDIKEFSVSSATVELAAKALRVEPSRIAKSMSFQNPLGDGCILIITAGDAKIDNAKFKNQFKFKPKMLSADEVLLYTGHEIGGVCPFANPKNIKKYMDNSLKRFDSVFPACGSDNSAIELTIDELYELSKSEGYVDVCKGWYENEQS